MNRLMTFYGVEPVIETKVENGKTYGLHRDRNPDSGWGEWRWSLIDKNEMVCHEAKLEEMPKKEAGDLLRILIEDVANLYGKESRKFSEKLAEFDISFEVSIGSKSDIDKAIDKFTELKDKAPNLRDAVYLDGVLAILETIKKDGKEKTH